MVDPRKGSRRDFLTGKSALNEARAAGERALEDVAATPIPTGGDTVRLSAHAMACEFAAVLNPGPSRQVVLASDALDLLEPLEQLMTVYREDADLLHVNRAAADGPVAVDPRLFAVLSEAARIAVATDRAFDPTSGPLIDLWRRCRDAERVPTDEEIAETLPRTGIEHVQLDPGAETVSFDTSGVELNLGGIGKGFALDRCAAFLDGEELGDFLLHGGRSSVLARGGHAGHDGWPIGVMNPLTRNERLATLLLRNAGMSTSGSSVQFFRHDGRRYGHILDPRTGRPCEGMLSVTVVAPTAAEADALSTAFFVGGVENACRYCDNREGTGAVVIPLPTGGRTLRPVVVGLDDETLFFHETAVEPEFVR